MLMCLVHRICASVNDPPISHENTDNPHSQYSSQPNNAACSLYHSFQYSIFPVRHHITRKKRHLKIVFSQDKRSQSNHLEFTIYRFRIILILINHLASIVWNCRLFRKINRDLFTDFSKVKVFKPLLFCNGTIPEG